MKNIYKPKILILFFINYEKWFALFKAKLQKKEEFYVLNRMRTKHILLFFIKGAKYNKLDNIAKELILLKINEIDLIKIIEKNTAKLQFDVL